MARASSSDYSISSAMLMAGQQLLTHGSTSQHSCNQKVRSPSSTSQFVIFVSSSLGCPFRRFVPVRCCWCSCCQSRLWERLARRKRIDINTLTRAFLTLLCDVASQLVVLVCPIRCFKLSAHFITMSYANY